MIYLSKQDKNIEKNKELGTEKYPYFTLSLAPDKDKGETEWVELGAFWKKVAPSGKVGYSGKLNENVKLVVTPKVIKPVEQKPIVNIPYPEEEIDLNSIPF